MSHVASTYAAVMAIVNLASEDGYKLINLPAMNKYLISVKNNFKAENPNNFFNYNSNIAAND